MPSAKRPVLDATALRQRLAGLRRRLRLVATVRGVGFLLSVLLAVGVAAGLLDWQWHLPALVRALVLVAALTGGILISYRYLFRPLSAPSDDLSLALRVEEKYPALNDALASTVQFLERGVATESSSTVLEREAVKHALGRAAGCDFLEVVNKRGVWWAGASGGAFVALTLTLIFLSPRLAATAFLRLAHPFGDINWPKKTQLALDEPKLRIGRNEAFEVSGQVHGVIPPQATVVFRMQGRSNLSHQCDVKVDEKGVGRFQTRLASGQVEHNFHFYVKANDAVSPEYAVAVLAPPTLTSLDGNPSPRVRLSYPAYTRLPSPETLSPGNGNIDAVAGTVARLRARADRPLRRAWIEYQPEDVNATLSDILTVFDGGKPWWENVPAVLDDDRRTFTLEFTPTRTGNYVLHFEDETGLSNSRLFELRVEDDPAPTVKLERPSPSHDILQVLPDAELALVVAADDVRYAVRSVYLEYRTSREEPWRRLYLYDPAVGPAPFVSPWAGVAVLAAPALPTQPQRLDFRQKLSLKTLHNSQGGALKEEDTVFLRACADDYDDVTVDKLPGRSPEIELRIVGRNALEIVLNQEQAAIQQELLRVREQEREAIRKVSEVENRLKKGEKLNDADREKLLQAEKTQQQIRERIGGENEGLRSDVKRVLDALKQNGMEKSAAKERMSDVARELNRLSENELQQIEPRLTEARQLAEQLEEKAREERKKQLDARAKEADQEARVSEQMADRRDREANESDKKAAQSATENEKAREMQEAKRQRQRAEELRQRAKELRQQAERDRKDANRTPDPDKPRQNLAEARKSQEEVEKTINDLLTRRLEPWTNSHEIKGEARQLLEEQKRLEAESEKLNEKGQKEGFAGKLPSELTPAQKAELENIQNGQQKVEERTRQLMEKMGRVASQREEKDPETARELREAVQQAQQDNLLDSMREARSELEQNNLNDARRKQQDVVRDLKKLVKNLEDRREAELDRLAKKLREKEKELDDLVKEQEELRKKTKEAGEIGDKGKHEEELKRLSKRQEDLRKKTEEMVRQLTRLRASRAGQSLAQAGEQMAGAGEQMNGGKESEDQQEETLERLNEAQRELQRARKEAEEELGREQITRLTELIRPLKERQEALNAETNRAQENVQRKGKWDRALRGDYLRKSEAQKGLGAETLELAEKRLSHAPVFARLMRRAGEAMNDAGERMNTVAKETVDPKELPDADTTRLQQTAQRRLAQVVDALKEAAERMELARNGGGEGGGEGGEGAGGSAPPSDGIPPLAQLKLLRDMQKEINRRTETFRKEHIDLKKIPDKDRAELEAIRKDQQDVAELIDELNRPAGEPGDAEGEKK
jgi:hypothetical protein